VRQTEAPGRRPARRCRPATRRCLDCSPRSWRRPLRHQKPRWTLALRHACWPRGWMVVWWEKVGPECSELRPINDVMGGTSRLRAEATGVIGGRRLQILVGSGWNARLCRDWVHVKVCSRPAAACQHGFTFELSSHVPCPFCRPPRVSGGRNCVVLPPTIFMFMGLWSGGHDTLSRVSMSSPSMNLIPGLPSFQD
jgi:hypothetical protein